jgi:hypothetical protein
MCWSGDTNGDGAVNSGDISQTKSQSGIAVTNSNYREDLNNDGAIDSADIALVKSKSGTGLPAGTTTSNPVTATSPSSDGSLQPDTAKTRRAKPRSQDKISNR